MGCFLACFGLPKKRKRRKTLYKVLAAPGHQNYVALDSSVTVNLAATPDNSIVPYSNLRDECKEKTRPKTRKKVSFNLNVQIYEPNPTAYQILESEEGEENNKDNDIKEKSGSSSILGENSAALNYPSNHRYYNCLDTYNEEDEIEDEASDGYDDDDDEFDDDDDDWDYANSENGEDQDWSKVCDRNAVENQCSETINSSLEEEQVKSQMHSVLKPVENLTQWKAIKAQVASSKHRRKEDVPPVQKTSMELLSEPGFNLLESNVSKPLLTEIAVDASLSNWLVPPYASKTTIHCQ